LEEFTNQNISLIRKIVNDASKKSSDLDGIFPDKDLYRLEEVNYKLSQLGTNYLPDEMIDPSLIDLLTRTTGLKPRRY
jgi:hypothetical protein